MKEQLRQTLADNFHHEARLCAAKNAAPTYAALLESCAVEIRDGKLLDPVLEGWTDPATTAAVGLRIMGALHRLVLDGRAPELAAVFPSAGGKADPSRVWTLARPVVAREADFITGYLARPPQTNEVGRSAGLIGGFLIIASETRLPLRLLEPGASAGLNLFCDRFRIEGPEFAVGPADLTVKIACAWEGPPPPLATLTVAERRGCDRDPADLRRAEDRQRLASYVWTDQTARFTRLQNAIAVALAGDFTLERDEAEQWLARGLRHLPEGLATVVYHSSFWSYLPAATRETIADTIAAAGARASSRAPLAWLRMEAEGTDPLAHVRLTVWPGGTTRALATAHFHGDFVRWNG